MGDKDILTRVDQMIAEVRRTDEMERRLRKADARQSTHSTDVAAARVEKLLRWRDRLQLNGRADDKFAS